MVAVRHEEVNGTDERARNRDGSSSNVSGLPGGGTHIRLHRAGNVLAPPGMMRPQHSQGAMALDYDPWMATLEHLGELQPSRLLYAAIAKRGIDLILATLLLLVTSPIILAAAVWIVADTFGNPFFCQKRVGKDGRNFTLIKLRTMKPCDSERLVWTFDENGQLRHKVKDDTRITQPGKWLRRTSVDELPQLWNVIRGDMSLVGPRPELPEIVMRYEPWQHQRHVVRPGLTGWWQVSGRSELPMHEHTDLDLYYVNRMSPGLDWLIATRTLAVVFRGLGAF